MFREIIDLRKKINTLEDSIANITKQCITNNSNKVLSKPSEEKPSEEKPIFQIPLPGIFSGTNTGKPIFQIPLPTINNNSLPTINEDILVCEIESDEEEISLSGEHLAIYSNDNEEDIIENYSLGNSSEIITPDNINNKTLLNDSEDSRELVDNHSSISTEITIPETLNFETLHLENINNDGNTSIIHTVPDLMKHKLNELQCIAESLSIELIYNGKKKTKSDLSKEIVNIYNTN